jgi:hypothetical protein
MHKSYKPYNDYSDKIKANVNTVLNMIKEISCNNDENLYDAYIKYISQLCHGIKTEVVIYKKSEQGTGKSTETDFLMNHVLGKDICVISGTEPLLKDFNKILMGKLLVIFEELPTFSTREWEAVSSKIKTFTTEKTSIFRGLFKEPVQAENNMNFVINTNCDSIKDSNGRRIMIMPINTIRKGDYEYFKKIRDDCFNDQVGEAFFAYMKTEVNIDGFYAQKDFPENENKQFAISNLLHSTFKFIKYNYVLANKEIKKVKPDELYEEYTNYCINNGCKTIGKNDFMKKLKEVGIVHRKTCGNNYYFCTCDELKVISDKNKWVCDYYDEYSNVDENETTVEDDDDDDMDYKTKYLNLLKENETLKAELRKCRDLLENNL